MALGWKSDMNFTPTKSHVLFDNIGYSLLFKPNSLSKFIATINISEANMTLSITPNLILKTNSYLLL